MQGASFEELCVDKAVTGAVLRELQAGVCPSYIFAFCFLRYVWILLQESYMKSLDLNWLIADIKIISK